MNALPLLFACLLLGVLVARYARPPAGTVPGLNWWVIRVALPALVLELVPRLKLDAQLWFPVVAIWIVFFGAWLLFAVLGRQLGWSRERIGALTLVCGLGNTSFMGYPMMLAMHGKEGLSLAVVADQIGCFPLLSSVGVAVAAFYAGKTPQPSVMARQVLTFPAFIALVVGLTVGALGGWPAWLDSVFSPIGATLTPLALFSVGLQFRFHLAERQLSALLVGLGWKLLLAPLAAWGLGVIAGVGGLILTVGVLQAAMAPMISAAILADQYKLEPALANTILGAGIVLSLVTVPLGNLLLTG